MARDSDCQERGFREGDNGNVHRKWLFADMPWQQEFFPVYIHVHMCTCMRDSCRGIERMLGLAFVCINAYVGIHMREWVRVTVYASVRVGVAVHIFLWVKVLTGCATPCFMVCVPLLLRFCMYVWVHVFKFECMHSSLSTCIQAAASRHRISWRFHNYYISACITVCARIQPMCKRLYIHIYIHIHIYMQIYIYWFDIGNIIL